MFKEAFVGVLCRWLVFAILIGLSGASHAAPSGDEIVLKADEMRYINADVSFKVEVNDLKSGKSQKTVFKVFAKGAAMSRVETIFPERQAGRKLLMTDDALWLFTPDIKRATRVSMQQKLTGEVANGDIARTNFSKDYGAELKGEVKLDGKDAYFLSLKKKRDDVTYAAIDYWVAKGTFVPLKAIFKTEGGKDLKTAIYKDLKPFLKKKLISKMEIVSTLNSNQKSILIFGSYKKEKLDESFFNKESLNN
jgi:outer membrane lipoprotein-sorting protein